MKILSLILSIYFLLLVCIPCRDAKEMHAADVQSAVLTSYNNDHLSHQNDGCTPLCSCSCCQIAVTGPEYIVHKTILQKKEGMLSTFSNTYLEEVSLPFWQPPKIQG